MNDPALQQQSLPINLKKYQLVLSLTLAVEEINKNPQLLPNMTLGFEIYIAHYVETDVLENPLTWLSGKDKNSPNYTCRRDSKALAVLTGSSSTSVPIRTLLDLYKLPQFTFGSFDPLLGDHRQFDAIYQMAAKDSSLALAMVSLMVHFSWTWVGLFITEDDYGVWFLSELREEMGRNGVCFAFENTIQTNAVSDFSSDPSVYHHIMESSTNVIIIYGDKESHNIYNAVYAVAHALHEMLFYQTEEPPAHNEQPKAILSSQLHLFLKKIQFTNPAGEQVVLNEQKKLEAEYDIVSFWNFPEGLGQRVNVGKFTPSRPHGQQLILFENLIEWPIEYIKYEDPLGMGLACMALCFSALTCAVLGVFVKHQDTPIVKANNRAFSYLLLISLTCCFLCSLLFLGRPHTASCILQHTTFAVVFTVAVSTVLAKTITVVLAFTLTAPGRSTRQWLVSRFPSLIIPICTLIQVTLCGLWLGISPPFVDTDAHSEHGHIIILCNMGSLITFYCVLGYLGFLALASFVVAFLVRNLPDTFNEAKFLTFSMLVFCSVWLSFLPVYHSAKGKVLVAVEVFSILVSSAGLLGCIFAPKCYIILIKPERNTLQRFGKKSRSGRNEP
ncbi:PREDICTED: vomeronasal type-2 receptor 116-like [Dipodomys ordii]|uniref:Vomeronasal type-2 receptor 116-like n=1 Tax=Dipodomys ordii TaxID=10020 RepID=A0A1S3GSV4_DIPOR|nr:PREDICTED: vomeronasal type-2 receptor 116-like [Dipodomys ordii]